MSSRRLRSTLILGPESSVRCASGDDDGGSSFLGNTMKSILGRCAGIVDAASFVIQSCRGDDEEERNKDGDTLGPLVGPARGSRKARRKQGGTLEFLADDGFEDDVSALSANTLEEMERWSRRMGYQTSIARKSDDGRDQPYPGQQLLAPTTVSQSNKSRATDWVLPMQRTASNADESFGVATSGSSSTNDDVPVQNTERRRPEGMQILKVQVEV